MKISVEYKFQTAPVYFVNFFHGGEGCVGPLRSTIPPFKCNLNTRL